MHASLRAAVLGVLVAGLAASPAAAQTPAGGSWGSWAGCWRLITETGVVTAGADQPTVCVAVIPEGARLTTTIDGKVALEQTIPANGVSRPVDDGECRGTERYEFSANGLRVYSRTEVTCSGSPRPRLISGYSLLLQDGTWLDIQAVEMAPNDSVRIRRYRRVDSAIAARPAPGQALDIADVKEAIGKLALPAVEAAIAESGTAIRLSSKLLLELDAARVPDRVIDLLVAKAYPEKFTVDQPSTDRGRAYHGSLFYGYPYYYSPFGYSPYGWYDYYYPAYYPGGGGIVVIPPGGGTVPPPVATGAGRAVDGRGYTQVRPRDDSGARVSTTPGATAGGTVGAASASESSSSGSSSSGGSVSSGGFSSGGGGDTGRTAVPR